MSIYIYILTMAVTTYLIRVLPLTVFRKPIRSRFLKSFLHYVPYACLTAMTFPAILTATESVISGAAALIVGVVLALVLSCLFAWVPLFQQVSAGISIVICTVGAAALCAWLFPIPEEVAE